MPELEIYVPLKGAVDIEKEKMRLEKEIAKVSSDLQKVESKLSNESFVSKAPQEVIEKEKAKQKELKEILEKLKEGLTKLN